MKNWFDKIEEKMKDVTTQSQLDMEDYVIPKVMFPLVRRVMPELISNKLVSVQPLEIPKDSIYYIKYIFSKSPNRKHYDLKMEIE